MPRLQKMPPKDSQNTEQKMHGTGQDFCNFFVVFNFGQLAFDLEVMQWMAKSLNLMSITLATVIGINCDLFTSCVFSEWESICLFVFRYQLMLHLLAVLYLVYKCSWASSK